MTAARSYDPSFVVAYGVSCRARAKKVALRRAHGGDSPHATEVAMGPPLPVDGHDRDSAGQNDRGNLAKNWADGSRSGEIREISPRPCWFLTTQDGIRDGQCDLCAGLPRGRQQVLVRGVGAAAARAQTVDGERDRGREVAGVAGSAAAGADDAAPE